MSSKKARHTEPREETHPEPAQLNEQPEESVTAKTPEAAPDLTEIQEQLAEAQSQAAEFKDGWQRAVAEFQNYRKRIERENSDVYRNAVSNIIKRYLPVMDDLERALHSRPADLAWAEGIELIYRKLESILEAEGIQRIQAEGKMFDPNFHEAISQEPSEGHCSGQVIAVVRNGYMLGERVIRPAMVRVAQ